MRSETLVPPAAELRGALDRRLRDWPAAPAGETALFARLKELCEEGMAISIRLSEARGGHWHSFAPADYVTLLKGLLIVRRRGGRFLEMGSGIGVIAIMADLLGIEACGIEIAPELVRESRDLATRYGSGARFATGSFLPAGYRWVSASGDTRMGALGIGASAYEELGLELADFDWVYAYPWPGEGDILHDVMRRFGAADAHLLVHGYAGGLESYGVQ